MTPMSRARTIKHPRRRLNPKTRTWSRGMVTGRPREPAESPDLAQMGHHGIHVYDDRVDHLRQQCICVRHPGHGPGVPCVYRSHRPGHESGHLRLCRRALDLGFAIFAIFQIPVAVAQNMQTILVSRFMVGVFGCSPLACMGGAMADIWNPLDRAVAIAMFAASTFLGPVMGPIVRRGWPHIQGVFITESHLGWHWTAWIAKTLRSCRTGPLNWALHSFLDEHEPTLNDIGHKYLLRPVEMFVLEPILICVTIYLALIYGILYLFIEAYPVSFGEVRQWTHAGVAALPFVGIAVGVFMGVALIIYTTKTRFARKLAKHGRVVPEERLIPMMIASALLPAGLFWFGWTSDRSIFWVPQVIAGGPIGMGILVIFIQGLNFIIDCYMMFANSATAANTLVQSLVGGAFPLFATQMYHNLGVD
ncbi:Major facilitator superfamily domain general substrate transporter [Penicillium capsulatum]|uniref:Major facilitator superfamily domain general substrate transporter n=1 Tax=Penicillium capsulatum TaxID=69766 RepID=A0A9W9ISK2_9EURO|nr:Major facilitator superfamily domain general substrate transporter [Penicillium capsulatum]